MRAGRGARGGHGGIVSGSVVSKRNSMGPLESLKSKMPWWSKMAAKLVRSRLPLSYGFWRSIGLYRHGRMAWLDYAVGVYSGHHKRAARWLADHPTVLELGPGDSLASGAGLAHAFGASKTYLVDVGRYATQDIEPYRDLCERLWEEGRLEEGLESCATIREVVEMAGGGYLSEGLQSPRSIPKDSVDFIFSHAVLEHVPLADFTPTVQTMYDAQAPSGVCSHRIDVRDHLGDSLHSLRFPSRFWEARLVASSGFYTNRLRSRQVVSAFESAGYEVLAVEPDTWAKMPLPRHKLHPDFAQIAEQDLLIKGMDLLARKPAAGGA